MLANIIRNILFVQPPAKRCRFHSTSLPQTTIGEIPYWNKIGIWGNISREEFLSYSWQVKNTVRTPRQLCQFLREVLPDVIKPSQSHRLHHIKTREDFIRDVEASLQNNTNSMEIRITPHLLSQINWNNALDDPIRRQFIPIASATLPNHPRLSFDSLSEEADSPVEGLVHRYPDRVLFLALSTCPVYCRFCTRSYAIGGNTETLLKKPQKPSLSRWELAFNYIEKNENIKDVVVSGGDAYHLQPENLRMIGERLLAIRHIRRFRFASKGLATAPSRIIDRRDKWADALIDLSDQGRKRGTQVCFHTHFNHPNEINWITKRAAGRLFANGVIMRNQSVLLKGVNDSVTTMGSLIAELADMNVQPYYVYQCDLVPNVEDLRTPLSTICHLEKALRGTISGFMMPSFVVDLPGGGGKRLVSTYEEYNNGIARFTAPGLPGKKGLKEFYYHDPASDGAP